MISFAHALPGVNPAAANPQTTPASGANPLEKPAIQIAMAQCTAGIASGVPMPLYEPKPHEYRSAIQASNRTQGRKNLLLKIVDHAAYGLSSCFAHNETLCEETGLGITHVSNCIQEFVLDGTLVIERSGRFGPRTLAIGFGLKAETVRHMAENEARKQVRRNRLQPPTLYERAYAKSVSPAYTLTPTECKPLTLPLNVIEKPLNVAENDNGFASLLETQTPEPQDEVTPQVGPHELAELEHQASGKAGRVAQAVARAKLAGLKNERQPQPTQQPKTPEIVSQAIVGLQVESAAKAISQPTVDPSVDMETKFRRLASPTMPDAVVEQLAQAVASRLDDAHSLAWHRRTYAQVRAIEDPARRMAAAVGCWRAYERSRTMPCRDRRRVFVAAVLKVVWSKPD